MRQEVERGLGREGGGEQEAAGAGEAWGGSWTGSEGRVWVAPPELCGPGEQWWVRLRPLTWREALQRESLASREEFEVDQAGVVRAVHRRWEALAAREFDLTHCLLECLLPSRRGPGAGAPGQGNENRGEARQPERGGSALAQRLLEELPPPLAAWLEAALDEVNLRAPGEQARLAEVKKNCPG